MGVDAPELDEREDISVFDPETCQPRLLSAQCTTCIGRPGNLMMLRPGRVKQMVADALRSGTGIVCHQTLPYGGHKDTGPAFCRWFWSTYGYRVALFGRIARTTGWTVVDPPAGEGGPDGG